MLVVVVHEPLAVVNNEQFGFGWEPHLLRYFVLEIYELNIVVTGLEIVTQAGKAVLAVLVTFLFLSIGRLHRRKGLGAHFHVILRNRTCPIARLNGMLSLAHARSWRRQALAPDRGLAPLDEVG